MIAFVLPIFLFVATLAGFGRLLQGHLDASLQSPAAFVLALSTTMGLMLPISLTVKRFHGDR